MKRTIAILAASVALLAGCDSASPSNNVPNPTTRAYTAKPEHTTAPNKPRVQKTMQAPDSSYQELRYDSAYRWIIDGHSVSVYISDPADSRPVVTNSGTQIVTFNVTIKAYDSWPGRAAKLSFDSRTNESFYFITAQGDKPFSDDLSAGQTRVYKMKLEAPMDTYKQGHITLSYEGKKIATWS